MLPEYLVAIIVPNDDSWRMLAAFQNSVDKTTFIQYLTGQLNAGTAGDWYTVDNNNAGDTSRDRAQELGASTFMLDPTGGPNM